MSAAPRPWLAFSVAGTAIYLTILDLFIVNVAIGAIGSDFAATSAADLSWVLTIYAILFAAVLVPAGRLGDRFGRRRVFSAGLGLFLLGSLLAGIAPGYGVLLVGRAVQAVGAALATPNSLGAVLPMFEQRQRPAVLGVWGMIAASGAASGPPLGGILAQVDWRWIFLVNLPVGLVALVLIARVIRESPAEQGTRTDWVGAATLAAAIAALTLGLAQSESWGWDARVLGAVLVAAVLGALLALRSRRHPDPILEPDLFRRRGFGAAMLGTAAFWGAFAALLLASSLYLTAVRGYDVLEAGLRMAPGPAVSAVAAAVAGRLAGKVPPLRLALAGTAALAAGALVLGITLGDTSSYAWTFLPGSLLAGIGAGTAIPNLLALALVGVPPHRFATGVAIYTVFRQVGSAVGTAAWVAAIGTGSLALAATYRVGWWVVVAGALVALGALVSVAARTMAPEPPPEPATTKENHVRSR
ncbi:EmrB/QacA subfamily drug resistance transporter [Nocardioides thalensis]|uniref:EmrB/QacA subfamily drug resistance transporter n=1 Tax=Nocardioides thalensis TaxID=1914755 RepID=A0A853C1E6_9ACTN|nr:MFS transporter [Nocardioides thalensis]NYJ00542.1 EmrB/QacA subfamily drug resistance transporter [Nocardioides thalensis]